VNDRWSENDGLTDDWVQTESDPGPVNEPDLAPEVGAAETVPGAVPDAVSDAMPGADISPAGAPGGFGLAIPRPDPQPEILLPPVVPDDEPIRPATSARHWYSLTGTSPLDEPHGPVAPSTASGSGLPVSRKAFSQHKTTRDRVRQRKLRRQRGIPDDWASMVIVSALVGVTTVIGIAIFFIIRAATVAGTVTATSVPQQPTSIFYGAAGGALGAESLVINPWSGDERFTVLLMGKDKRPGEFGSAFLTDSMMLISLDPQTKRVGILSLPRDLQVEIPEGNYGVQPINTAYRLGELDGPGGGPRLAMITVQYNFGIAVNDYLVVDFETFIRIIDEIGGINVEVKKTIDDPEYPDMNYGYDPFYLEAGWHLLDGETALKFARSRHQTDDIDRAARQQQVLYAVRDKIISANMLPELAAKAYPLYAELKNGIDTSLSLDQMLELAWYVKDIDRHNIVSGVIGWDYIIAENWNGRPIIRPNRERLPELLTQIFGPNYDQRATGS